MGNEKDKSYIGPSKMTKVEKKDKHKNKDKSMMSKPESVRKAVKKKENKEDHKGKLQLAMEFLNLPVAEHKEKNEKKEEKGDKGDKKKKGSRRGKKAAAGGSDKSRHGGGDLSPTNKSKMGEKEKKTEREKEKKTDRDEDDSNKDKDKHRNHESPNNSSTENTRRDVSKVEVSLFGTETMDPKTENETNVEMDRKDGADMEGRRKKNVVKIEYTPELKEEINSFLRKYMTLGVSGVCAEWEQQIKLYYPPGMTTAAFDANPDKNRYKDMICIDQTRVVLTLGTGGDYIHANIVEGEPLKNRFICTQGPLLTSIADFWRMCVQEKVTHIAMLCEEIENGKRKCERYWPENPGETLTAGDYTIKTIGMDNGKTFRDGEGVTRVIEITGPANVVKRLRHHIWKAWPDKNVPESKLACLRLLKQLRQSSGTSVVHCSAGVGRTGTFVAIEWTMQELTKTGNTNVSLIDIVQKLRGKRMTAVQTDLQYAYIVLVMAMFFYRNNTLVDDTKKLLRTFSKEFDALSANKFGGKTGGGAIPPTILANPSPAEGGGGGGAASTPDAHSPF